MRLRICGPILCVAIFAFGVGQVASDAGAAKRTPYCSALLKVLTTDADSVQNSMVTKIDEKFKRPLTPSMKASRESIVKTVGQAKAYAPNLSDSSLLTKYRSRLEAATTSRPLIDTVWAFDTTGSRKPLFACRGQYKTIVSPAAPFGPAP